MARDDNMGAMAAGAALAAAVFSPQVRGLLHRGAVHGLAGVLIAGDAITSFARGVGRGVQQPVMGAAGAPDAAPAAPAGAAEAAEAAEAAAEDTSPSTGD